jgi:hypothetical protein
MNTREYFVNIIKPITSIVAYITTHHKMFKYGFKH